MIARYPEAIRCLLTLHRPFFQMFSHLEIYDCVLSRSDFHVKLKHLD